MIVLNYTEMRIYCQRQRCSPRCGFWRYKSYADIRRGSLPAGEVVSNENAVVENASFLLRSLYLPYEAPLWLYISKFTRIRAVYLLQHGSCPEA